MKPLYEIGQYAIGCHESTNHYYDKYIPYEYHLRQVVRTAHKFKHLVTDEFWQHVVAACWCHDVIEDTRQSYNDVYEAVGNDYYVADLVRAVTNDCRGKNRRERFSEDVYKDIRETPYATFVKLCDRIANAQYSKETGSSMFEMYKKENAHFESMLNVSDDFAEMFAYLKSLFTQE